MSETQGQIHGLISREQMHDMWLPYGERLSPMPTLGISDIDPEIVAHTASGARPTHLKRIAVLSGVSGRGTNHLERLQPTLEANGISHQLGEYVLEVIDDQISEEQERRDRELGEHPNFLQLFRLAVTRLDRDGWLMPIEDVEPYLERLWNNNGQPFFEPVPVAPIHLLLSERERNLPAPPLDFGGAFDPSLGVVYEVLSFRDRQLNIEHGRSRKVHEHIHAIDGLEVWDVTYTDGTRGPELARSGIYGTQPSTEKFDSYDYTDCENFDANEGMKELLTVVALRAVRRLGKHNTRERYLGFAQSAANLFGSHGAIADAMVKASFVDASPQNPESKVEAIYNMHRIADKEFGVVGALDKYMAGEI